MDDCVAIRNALHSSIMNLEFKDFTWNRFHMEWPYGFSFSHQLLESLLAMANDTVEHNFIKLYLLKSSSMTMYYNHVLCV